MPTFNFVRFVVRPTERPSGPLLPYCPQHLAIVHLTLLRFWPRADRADQARPGHIVYGDLLARHFDVTAFFQHFWGQSNWLAAVKQLALGLLISGCSCCCCCFCYCCTRVTVAAASQLIATVASCRLQLCWRSCWPKCIRIGLATERSIIWPISQSSHQSNKQSISIFNSAMQIRMPS